MGRRHPEKTLSTYRRGSEAITGARLPSLLRHANATPSFLSPTSYLFFQTRNQGRTQLSERILLNLHYALTRNPESFTKGFQCPTFMKPNVIAQLQYLLFTEKSSENSQYNVSNNLSAGTLLESNTSPDKRFTMFAMLGSRLSHNSVCGITLASRPDALRRFTFDNVPRAEDGNPGRCDSSRISSFDFAAFTLLSPSLNSSNINLRFQSGGLPLDLTSPLISSSKIDRTRDSSKRPTAAKPFISAIPNPRLNSCSSLPPIRHATHAGNSLSASRVWHPLLLRCCLLRG